MPELLQGALDSTAASSLPLAALLPESPLVPTPNVPAPDGAMMSPLFELVVAGGPVVALLLLLSVIALTLILVKAWQFLRMRPNGQAPVLQALQQFRQGGDIAVDGRHVWHPVVRVLQETCRMVQQRKLPQPLLREEAHRLARLQLESLRGFLRPLEVIAQVSPLLGLLGTVLGMIDAFQQLASAGQQVDPAMLSGGIWQALLTTAVGISVAIPVLMMHNWFERQVERCALSMEDALTQIFTWLPAQESARPLKMERHSHAA